MDCEWCLAALLTLTVVRISMINLCFERLITHPSILGPAALVSWEKHSFLKTAFSPQVCENQFCWPKPELFQSRHWVLSLFFPVPNCKCVAVLFNMFHMVKWKNYFAYQTDADTGWCKSVGKPTVISSLPPAMMKHKPSWIMAEAGQSPDLVWYWLQNHRVNAPCIKN